MDTTYSKVVFSDRQPDTVTAIKLNHLRDDLSQAIAAGGGGGASTGDMTKAVYDTNNNGKVDTADAIPWANVTGKPAVIGDMTKAVYDTNNDGISDHAALADTAPWTGITGKPSTYPPDSTAMLKSVYDANGNNKVDGAESADSAPWTGITGKPSTFPAAAHAPTHLDNGSDPIPVVTATRTGLTPKLSGSATTFLDGTGVFSTPSATSGPPGANGQPAWTLTTSGFTVPPIGSTVVVNVADTTWATIGEYVWVQSSPTVSDALKITAKTSTSVTLLNPPTAGMQASGDAQNLLTVGSDSLLYLPPSAIQPVIWSQRLRSFNAVGNPTFEVDQANCGSALTIGPGSGGIRAADRWFASNVPGAGNLFTQQIVQNNVVPGTSFLISNKVLQLNFGTQKASLAATDVLFLSQVIEGAVFRELINDVTSLSLLVSTNVSGGLKFAVSIRDNITATPTRSLVKLCTISAANTPTLIQLPNLPVAPPAGTWGTTPGSAGYGLGICLAAGTTYTAPANDVWQNGNFVGAVGMDNFLSKPVGSVLQIAFVQHEPGSQCTTPIDCPFGVNYDGPMGCTRYWQKSYDYGTKPGTVTFNGANLGFIAYSTTAAAGAGLFPKRMAKVPAIGIYHPNTGASGSIYDMSSGSAISISSVDLLGEGAFGRLNGTGLTATRSFAVHWTADTGF